MTSDLDEFGPLVEQLLGKEFERSLATNSLKLRFGTQIDPRGTHYIWIDPPWEFYSPFGLVTISADYCDEDRKEWFELFNPINKAKLFFWSSNEDGAVIFHFSNGYYVIVPSIPEFRDNDDWYCHWYVSDRQLA